VYGDTDSNYITFPHKSSASWQELYDFCCMVSKEVSSHFPGTLLLDFEQVIYDSWLIINKKKYGYTELLPDGKVKMTVDEAGEAVPKLGAKGLLLVRRDNCEFVRRNYRRVILGLFARESIRSITNGVIEACLDMIRFGCNKSDFKYNTSVKEWGDGSVTINENGKRSCGSYTLSIPKRKPGEDVNMLYASRCVVNEQEYVQTCLPANAQLAQRITNRGIRVEPGERLDFVVHSPHVSQHMYSKREEYSHYCRYSDVFRIDYVYYIGALCRNLSAIFVAILKDNTGEFYPYDYFGLGLTEVIQEETISENGSVMKKSDKRLHMSKVKMRRFLNDAYKTLLGMDPCQRFFAQVKNKHAVNGAILAMFAPKIVLVTGETEHDQQDGVD
jgi:DNA polymerase elongation subunit (family B)